LEVDGTEQAPGKAGADSVAPPRDSAYFFQRSRRLLQLTCALSRRTPQLFDEQRQIDAVFLRRFNAASGSWIPQSLFGSRKLFGGQHSKHFHNSPWLR
jgi:hypothetical protein